VQKFIQSNVKTLQTSPFEYQSNIKKEDSNETKDIFNNWNNIINVPEKEKSPTQNFSLNLIDFDFLEGFGSTSTSSQVQKPLTEQNIKK
jgi:hypothetical protein